MRVQAGNFGRRAVQMRAISDKGVNGAACHPMTAPPLSSRAPGFLVEPFHELSLVRDTKPRNYLRGLCAAADLVPNRLQFSLSLQE